MSDFSTVDEILDYAIGMEQAAVDLYTKIAEKAANPTAKKVFQGFAAEERGHKAKLEAVKAGKKFVGSAKAVQDLKIADYLVEVDPEKVKDYQEALILGMKREKAAFKLYSDLAKVAQDDKVKQLFLALAQEEAKHKLQFEVEYDENILTEN